MSNRVSAAVDRALDDRQREASEEVERILSAAICVLERVTPQAPRVDAIVAEAGVSKKAFYKYFAGKDDLLLAVMERGVAIIVSYLEHQMAKESRPQEKIVRWIEGALAQVADPELISMSRAAVGQMSTADQTGPVDAIMAPMRDLLVKPVAALGGPEPLRDADAVFQITAAAMRRYVGSAEAPSAGDIDHLLRFCLGGLGVPREDGDR
ncbi:TetR/AcrR family transcriptional regulator [Mycolicibacterium komossense]|uniref:TetR family transcriptional regulator n=1 Tax=Mycolicibacterium komossense TaxID=1779 RepID=A0ABT3CHL2_9MYCO|nr:TetR/AcrR family transcriptional regulator [Mycolicibacterium komossense]MCV7228996.1 TetR family transcriptional regulator [Mycolicibacterium komossense]